MEGLFHWKFLCRQWLEYRHSYQHKIAAAPAALINSFCTLIYYRISQAGIAARTQTLLQGSTEKEKT